MTKIFDMGKNLTLNKNGDVFEVGKLEVFADFKAHSDKTYGRIASIMSVPKEHIGVPGQRRGQARCCVRKT
jgi:hypothetical protein